MTVKLRYKEPDGDTSKLIEVAVTDEGSSLDEASPDFVFAASVASFGMLLREQYALASPANGGMGDFTFAAVLELAGAAAGEDPFGYREEFLTLVDKAIEQRALGDGFWNEL